MNVGRVNSVEASCVVQDDPGEIVRGSRPLTAEDRVQLREQMIARLVSQSAASNPPPRWRAVDERVRLAMKGWRPGLSHSAETSAQ